MIDFDLAQARLTDAGTAPKQHETCSLTLALGRVLAQDIITRLDMPPADNSAMDGYAVCWEDLQASASLPIQARVYAGDVPPALIRGQAIRIFTGAPIPANADTVIMQENCSEQNGHVLINEPSPQGVNIRRRGEDMQAGLPLIAAGTVLHSAHIAQLAAQGIASITVYPRLKVGILTTGDELTAPGLALPPGHIYNSNAAMLQAQLADLGVHETDHLHASDSLESIQNALQTLSTNCDMVLTVGGVSVGDKDFVKPAIEAVGGKLDLWKVRMKPGKPLALAYLNRKPMVCLPGNPVSSYAVFTLMVSPLIRGLQGRHERHARLSKGKIQLDKPWFNEREDFIRVQATYAPDGQLLLQPFRNQGSGVISSLPWASGLARMPSGVQVHTNTLVDYYDFAYWRH